MYRKICDVVTNKPALFSHAVMFAQSDHEETGNLVPSGKEVPAGVETKNVYVLGHVGDRIVYWAEHMLQAVSGKQQVLLYVCVRYILRPELIRRSMGK